MDAVIARIAGELHLSSGAPAHYPRLRRPLSRDREGAGIPASFIKENEWTAS